MALKTFNIEQKIYEEYSRHCKKEGISMSRRIENFMKNEIEKIKSIFKDADKGFKTETNRSSDHPLKKYC